MEEFYTIKQICDEFTFINEKTLRYYVSKKLIKAMKFGRNMVFTRQMIIDFMHRDKQKEDARQEFEKKVDQKRLNKLLKRKKKP